MEDIKEKAANSLGNAFVDFKRVSTYARHKSNCTNVKERRNEKNLIIIIVFCEQI